ncbi:MAG: PQQ-dependent sugar dehydrogenase [Acidobacteriota bacterium]
MRLLHLASLSLYASAALGQSNPPVVTGAAAFNDLEQEHPGVRRHITIADLPAPDKEGAGIHASHIVARPAGITPIAPPGFSVALYADGFALPRLMRVAPNGDLFLSDCTSGQVIVMRGVGPDGKYLRREVFASKLDRPFGIAFYPLGPDPQWVYVANATSVVRFPYKNGDLQASAPPETLIRNLPALVLFNTSGHWTKDIVFTPDNKHLLLSVGAATDDADTTDYKLERGRAQVIEYTPTGTFELIYGSGIRNCVGEAINPTTGALWCSVNERNWMGDNLVPDFISSIPQGSFFGWPWWYIGEHLDPRHGKAHPVLQGPVREPDVLLPAHFASLEMVFYPQTIAPSAQPFPTEFQGDAFAAEHGSGNRNHLTGFEVVRIPMKDGKATGEFEDFLTGFDLPDHSIWGRPVGVAVGNDGALYVSEDASKTVWRVTWTGHQPAASASQPAH